jgi:hypothetical protein
MAIPFASRSAIESSIDAKRVSLKWAFKTYKDCQGRENFPRHRDHYDFSSWMPVRVPAEKGRNKHKPTNH